MKMFGYAGKILRVNLAEERIRQEQLRREFAEKYLGGKGFAARLLFDELRPGIDPLSPENKLVFATGPLTGSLAPGSSRGIVASKSPLTKGWGDSNAGGYFNSELKNAGYDVLIVEGRSKHPAYLWIDDDSVEIRDARSLWGRTTHETDRLIKRELHDESIQLCYIGPAGENIVGFANIISSWHRAFGRSGMGAVMGSKKLKAIAVRGTQGFEVAHPKTFLRVAMAAKKKLHGYLSPTPSEYVKNISYFGTSNLLTHMEESGMLPTCNFQSGTFEGAENISGKTMRDKLVVKDRGCMGCPISCRKMTLVRTGPYAGTVTSGPEYETIYALGSNCGNDCLESIAKASHLCDLFGIDTISCGEAIAFAMECYDKGILKTEDVELNFGNYEAIIKCIEMIAKRQGIGDLLAEGSRKAAEKLKAKYYAMETKGLELAGYDLRGALGQALATATSDRGGCHLRGGWTIAIELWNQKWPSGPARKEKGPSKPVDRFSPELKGEIVKWMQDWYAALDSLGMCCEVEVALFPDTMAELASAMTGLDISASSLLKYGERAYNLTRAFLVREGFSRKDDVLPDRFMEQRLESGETKGRKIDRKEFDKMLDDYYKARGWDLNGQPTAKKLTELGLEDVSNGLCQHGKRLRQC